MLGDIFIGVVILLVVFMLTLPSFLILLYLRSNAMPGSIRDAASRYCAKDDSNSTRVSVKGRSYIMTLDGFLLACKLEVSTEGILLKERRGMLLGIRAMNLFFPWDTLQSPEKITLPLRLAYCGRKKMWMNVKGTDIYLLIDPPIFENHFVGHFAQGFGYNVVNTNQ